MDYIIVWLDSNIDQWDEIYQNKIIQLQQVISSVNTFTGSNECIDFVTRLKSEKVFMIVSNDLGEEIIHLIQNIPQLESIYVLCDDHSNDKLWIKQCKKVRGVFTKIEKIYNSLNNEIRRYDNCLTTVNKISLIDSTTRGLNELDQSFMYSQLLKEAFLQIKDDDTTKEMKELLIFLRDQYTNYSVQLKLIADFEKQYDCHSAIKWYTKEVFIYSTLNKALRTQDIDVIVKMGFFIRDLHRQIVQLHSTSADSVSSIVYRGQVMLNTKFERLKNSKGSLLSFNNFLSTSVNRTVAGMYADSDRQKADMTGILFEIEIDRSISSSSFVVLGNHSQFVYEEEILFSMNTVFRIGDIELIDDRLWNVKLTLTSDTDEQLKRVTDSLRQEMGEEYGLQRLGHVMIMLDKLDKAEEIYSELRNFTTSDNWKELALLYNQLGSVNVAKSNYMVALSFFKKTADIEEQFLPLNHPDLAVTYNNIGGTYHSLTNYSMALDFHEKALRIRQECFPRDDLLLAATHNNIATDLKSMGSYQTARLKYQETVEIGENGCVPNHPKLATIYENLASLHTLLCEYEEALSFYSKALEINKKTLPSNHTSLLVTYNNIVVTYTSMGKYSEALSLYKDEIEVALTDRADNRPSLAVIYSNIGLVYLEMGNCAKASSYCEKALEIQKKNNSDNNLDMVITYSTMGHIYQKKGEFTEAHKFFEKARQIEEACLPSDHPDLATTYNDLGDLYRELKNYAEAHKYLQMALKIREECFRPDHPSLASVYNNIGAFHQDTRDYAAAIPLYEKALEINKKSAASNYRNLAINYSNIGNCYYSMRNYLAALEFFQKTLAIEQKSLGSEHPDLAYTHEYIAYTLEGLQLYKEAFIHLMKAIKILSDIIESDDRRMQILLDHSKFCETMFI